MTTAEKPPATFGGPGFVHRQGTLATDIEAGHFARYASASEVDPLEAVLLHRPGAEVQLDDPNEHLMLGPIDLDRIVAQHEAIAAAYRDAGVTVHIAAVDRAPPANFLFLRDTFVMTPAGAVIARMASEQRAGEERFVTRALALLDVPILSTIASGTLEGADVAFFRSDLAMIGIGRTDVAAADELAHRLADIGVASRQVPLDARTQHLLGAVVLLDRDLCALDVRRASPLLRETLTELGISAIELDDETEIRGQRAMNIVALAPKRILMPAGCPRTRAAFNNAGVETIEVEVGEYVKAGGALGCLTGILSRRSACA